MKSSLAEPLPIIGSPLGGGFYAGRVMIDGQPFAIVVAPKADGEHAETKWIGNRQAVAGAQSYIDGLANTKAMAEAGSKLAQWALDLRIGNFDDWYLPSQDELEVVYRNLKPTTEQNSCYARSGINLSAIEPTRPYTPDSHAQTVAELFRAGGEQAFADDWYWTSTQHAAYSDDAWYQNFDGGDQYGSSKSAELRARAVRRLPI